MNPYTEPHPDRSLLLTIDVQNDFTRTGAPAEIPGTRDCVPRIRKLLEACRRRNRPVVHVVRLYRSDGSNVDPCRRRSIESGEDVVRPGSEGAELVQELKPASNPRLDPDRLLAGKFQRLGNVEWAMYKPRWGAFYRTPLEEKLEQLSVDTLVVCGCNFPNCPRTTIYEASERDYRLVFVSDGTSGTYEQGLSELEDIGVRIMNASETVQWLEAE